MRHIITLSVLVITLGIACKKDDPEPIIINPCGVDFSTTLHYLAIGDGFSSGRYLQEGEAWTERMEALLESRGEVLSEFESLGSVTATTADLLEELDNADPACFNLATIMVGAHDHFTSRPLAEFRADYRSLIQQMVSLTGQANRVTCVSLPDYSVTPGLPFTTGSPSTAQNQIEAMNAIILDEAEQLGANYADIYPISQSLYSNLDAYVPNDSLHADADQHTVWAELIFAVAEANL